jgi:hypothetical protein
MITRLIASAILGAGLTACQGSGNVPTAGTDPAQVESNAVRCLKKQYPFKFIPFSRESLGR